jgi:hypothetical protein
MYLYQIMRRKIISYREFVEAVGQDVMDKIIDAFYHGFEDSVELIRLGNQRGVPVEYEPRTKASIAHDHIKSRLKNELSDISYVETSKWNGIFAIKFNDDAFANKEIHSGTAEVSVILTPQQKKFNRQLSMFGFPDEPTFITIGYYADKAWANCLGVYASCSTADGLLWFNKLGGEGFSQLSIFDSPTPIIPLPSTQTERKSV